MVTSSLATSDEIKQWLEWAGARLLSMPGGHIGPKSPGVAWPDYADDARTAYGYSPSAIRTERPNKDEIFFVDEILTLPHAIPDITRRRIVQSRSLVTPIAHRHLYSWTKLAKLLHTDRRTVANLYLRGLKEIIVRADQEKIRTINDFFATTYAQGLVLSDYP